MSHADLYFYLCQAMVHGHESIADALSAQGATLEEDVAGFYLWRGCAPLDPLPFARLCKYRGGQGSMLSQCIAVIVGQVK